MEKREEASFLSCNLKKSLYIIITCFIYLHFVLLRILVLFFSKLHELFVSRYSAGKRNTILKIDSQDE